jgi:hypothetical protein
MQSVDVHALLLLLLLLLCAWLPRVSVFAPTTAHKNFLAMNISTLWCVAHLITMEASTASLVMNQLHC